MTEAIEKIHPSWRTTLVGGLTALTVIFEKGLIPLLDGVDATKVDAGLCIAAILGFVAMFHARDGKVSSEGVVR